MEDGQDESTKVVVGLGNPGRKYAHTRHNVGFDVVELLARKWDLGAGREAFGGMVYAARSAPPCPGRRVLLFQPHTYMNLSGQAAATIAGFYRVAPADVLVVLDDLDLPLGRLRARAEGSAGGHKGLADVMRALGEVPRLRIGIGPRPERIEAVDFVLQAFLPEEKVVMSRALEAAARAVEDWVCKGIEFMMERHNRKPSEEKADNGKTHDSQSENV